MNESPLLERMLTQANDKPKLNVTKTITKTTKRNAKKSLAKSDSGKRRLATDEDVEEED